ncbi:hypothetical protein BHE74_00039454 [Ensete ventricosum]|nr:hypothetical protein BHE74_00039454 [Ensete ventricosum]
MPTRRKKRTIKAIFGIAGGLGFDRRWGGLQEKPKATAAPKHPQKVDMAGWAKTKAPPANMRAFNRTSWSRLLMLVLQVEEKTKPKVEDGIFGTLREGVWVTKQNELFVGRVAMLGFAVSVLRPLPSHSNLVLNSIIRSRRLLC